MSHNLKHIITTSFRLRASAVLAFAILLMFAVQAGAHGGFDHVIGTVVKVENNMMTVKTAKGDVVVKLDDKTEFSKDSAKAQLSDLTPGSRVVVDIPEGSKDNLAHSVKVGVAK